MLLLVPRRVLCTHGIISVSQTLVAFATFATSWKRRHEKTNVVNKMRSWSAAQLLGRICIFKMDHKQFYLVHWVAARKPGFYQSTQTRCCAVWAASCPPQAPVQDIYLLALKCVCGETIRSNEEPVSVWRVQHYPTSLYSLFFFADCHLSRRFHTRDCSEIVVLVSVGAAILFLSDLLSGSRLFLLLLSLAFKTCDCGNIMIFKIIN